VKERRDLDNLSHLSKSNGHLHAVPRSSLGGRHLGPIIVFQYEIWLNNQEQLKKSVTSGNRNEVRRAFIKRLLDLHEDGWSRQGYATYESP